MYANVLERDGIAHFMNTIEIGVSWKYDKIRLNHGIRFNDYYFDARHVAKRFGDEIWRL